MTLFFCDLDGTLIGEENNPSLPFFISWLKRNRNDILLIPSTGRGPRNMFRGLQENGIPLFSAAICSAGTEIVWGDTLESDPDWTSSLTAHWPREEILQTLKGVKDIVLQNEGDQGPGKLGYIVTGNDSKNVLDKVCSVLTQKGLPADVSICERYFLDVLAPGGNKGTAATFLAEKLGIPFSQILTAGNSGNDVPMMCLDTRSIAVGESPELKILKERDDVFWSKQPLAGGLVEGLRHWKIL